MRDIKVYFALLRLHILSALEYRGWWLLVVQVFVSCALEPLGTVLLFLRFGDIGEWSMERILLVYSLAYTSFGIAKTLCRGLDTFPWRMIRNGEFDRLLLRPKSLLVQTAASTFHIHRLALPVAGMIIMTWCLSRLGVRPTPMNILIILLALTGGAAVYMGVFIMTSGISFFTIRATDWIFVFTNASYQITKIPHDYIPALLRRMFTFFMPMLVVSYYPASVLCGWGAATWTAFMSLPVGLIFLWISTLVWRFGVRHYKSTGS